MKHSGNPGGLTAAILAGGKSRRMGRDKALLDSKGQSMLERVHAAAIGAGLPVVIVGRDKPSVGNWGNSEFVCDDVMECGPIGGLVTALRCTGTDVLLLACDLPLVTSNLLHWLLQRSLEHEECDGVVPTIVGKPEPTCAIYRQSCLAAVERRINARLFAIHEMIAEGKFALVCLPDELVPALTNINTPADWRDMDSRIRDGKT